MCNKTPVQPTKAVYCVSVRVGGDETGSPFKYFLMTGSRSRVPVDQIRRPPTENYRFALNFHSQSQGNPDNLGIVKMPSAALD